MKRTSFEIVAMILNFAQKGKRKTSIMNHCNLSFISASKTIDFLVQTNLLEKRDEFYSATEKGKEFVEKFLELEKLLGTPVVREDALVKKSR